MHSLFGVDVPAPALFFLVFIIVLGPLIWAVRRFGSGRLGSDAMRGRQQRLGVTEQAFLRDGRRQLILVRRDNVEHLMLIGGPTDVVVESNIVRAVAASRDVAVARPAPLEPLPRAIPLPDNGNGGWPLQPEPMTPPAAARPAPKIEPVADEPPAWPLQPQAETPPPRPQRDTLAALADELSARPTPPPPSPSPSPPPARSRPSGPPRGLEPRIEPRAERAERGEPRPEPRAEPRSAPAPATTDTAAADQSLAEMAHRLEAALRKPNAPAEARTAAPPRQAPAADQAAAPEPAAPAPPPMSRAARPQVEPKQPPRGNAPAKPPQPAQGGTLYDNLEQEMASLLGRPTNKN